MRRFWQIVMLTGVAVWMLLLPTAALASFGIEPGKVYVDNLFPGAKAEFDITVYNQGDEPATYVVKPRAPDYTDKEKGYEPLPYPEWVTATPAELTIAGGKNAKTLITITMPNDSTYFGKKAEIWISVMEKENPAMVRIEVASRVFVSTRAESAGKPPSGGTVGITAEAGKNQPLTSTGRTTIIAAVLAVFVIVAATLIYRAKHKKTSV